jgi:beta-glucanase (GH16 family)
MHLMRLRVLLALVLNQSLLTAIPVIPAEGDAPPGYKLVWSDEFSVDGKPNPANWSYEEGFVRNKEAQWYQTDNARVENGLLIIEARRERKMNPNYLPGSTDWKTNRQYAEYTSSSLLTRGLHTWQFGRFEMCGRIQIDTGLWPAWWTLGVTGEWPSNGEIDIMEFYQGKLLANVACGTTTRFTAKWDSIRKEISSFGDPGWLSKFHVWRMDWDNRKIDLYVDEILLNTTNLADMLNPDGTSPFRQPHYMILNLAIGGTSGGDPSATTFPARIEIDYVRVFQPK